MARIQLGGGGYHSEATSRPPPRCTAARQGAGLHQQSAGKFGLAEPRPPHPNTHGDVKGGPPSLVLWRSINPLHWRLSQSSALTHAPFMTGINVGKPPGGNPAVTNPSRPEGSALTKWSGA